MQHLSSKNIQTNEGKEKRTNDKQSFVRFFVSFRAK
jgi:hypothetical protein